MCPENRLRRLDREERIALCQEVMESLSDLVEGNASAELCERVDLLLADCQPYRAYRDTLEATIRLAREMGESDPVEDDPAREALFERAVRKARRQVAGQPEGD